MKTLIAIILALLSLTITGCDVEEINVEREIPITTEGFTVVPTMDDEITSDSAWCATFQLVWNDMKNELVKQDVVFTPQIKIAENLNKEKFTEDMISAEYYYKKFGLKSLELKAEIERGIEEKFDEESDILDRFDWSEDALNDPNNPYSHRYFFYTMLKRDFEYPKEFTILPEGTFGSEYNDIEYFGIDNSTDEVLDGQVEVLFYNSENDYAVCIETKNNDEVILYKNKSGNTFSEIYDDMINKSENYNGKRVFDKKDLLKVPNIEMNEIREYSELADKIFYDIDGNEMIIEKAIQSIQFEIDEKGGKIKSEAAIDVVKNTAFIPDETTPRYFYFDDTFTLFLKEVEKDVPYFALRVDDITKFQ